mmetsp:Transcript_212/g.480  ORF Transcript_212/g.480 Transcript_212/m.480 type:complete len:363 (-) Transcript_212:118-1206(-)
MDAVHLPFVAQQDVVQGVDKGVVLLDAGIIGKVRLVSVLRRIGTAHAPAGGGPFHPVFRGRPLGVALVHGSRGQQPVRRGSRSNVPVSRHHAGQLAIAITIAITVAIAIVIAIAIADLRRQFLHVPRRQVRVNGHDHRSVVRAGHVVVPDHKGLPCRPVPEPDRHNLVVAILRHGPGVLWGAARVGGPGETPESQKGPGGGRAPSVEAGCELCEGVRIGPPRFPGPPGFPLVREPGNVHVQHVVVLRFEGDRHSHVAIESLSVESRDEVVSLVGKVGVETARPVVGDLLEANDGGFFNLVVYFLEDDRESVLGIEVSWVVRRIVVGSGELGGQYVVARHAELEGSGVFRCHGRDEQGRFRKK